MSPPTPKLHGIDELRRAVRLFDNCNETFNQQFSPADLLLLADACVRSGWDFIFTPDQWDERQIAEALKGTAPNWREGGGRLGYTPVYLDGTVP
jgi:hypothetical protein